MYIRYRLESATLSWCIFIIVLFFFSRLYINHQPCSNLARGLRVGAHVTVYNVHLYRKGKVDLYFFIIIWLIILFEVIHRTHILCKSIRTTLSVLLSKLNNY